ALQGYRRLEGGRFGLGYDPAIGLAFQSGEIKDIDLWALWDRIRCPVLALRGATSDLLSVETAAGMQRRGPKAKLIEFAGVGHAPALMSEGQISAVRDWLIAAA
ncbi:MAG: alpha/beta fold hydrolase, partial [Dongiaceae bacterium]